MEEWFLEVDGKRTGPFTSDQILGLLSEGEIPETARVTSNDLGERWITVSELEKRNASPSPHPQTSRPTPTPRPPEAAPASRAKTFTPPPRPIELLSDDIATSPMLLITGITFLFAAW